jgi:4-carboxymuconolactone decarboxylase
MSRGDHVSLPQRFPPIAYDDMTAEQRAVVDAILAERGQPASRAVGGPFQPLLRSPGLALSVQQVGAQIRFHSSIPAPLNEMSIILTARRWTSQFEWHIHRQLALDAGLDPGWVDAIARRERPTDLDPEAGAVFDFVTELLATGSVSDPAFAAVQERFGERGVADLLGTVGYYCLISFVLNVDRCPVPDGAPLLEP